MPHSSEPTTLALHAVRLLGFADAGRVAGRFQLDRAAVESALEDFRASGWVTRSEFDGTAGWSLTEAGRLEHERRLAAELDAIAGRAALTAVHQAFVPLNSQIQDAVTKWQLRPIGGNRMAANDHTDFRWDDRVIRTLQSVGRRLVSMEAELTEQLAFRGLLQALRQRHHTRLDRTPVGRRSRYRLLPRRVDGVARGSTWDSRAATWTRQLI